MQQDISRLPKTDYLLLLRRAGYAEDVLRAVDDEFGDTIDLVRDGDTLARYGITRDALMNALGSGP